MTNSTVNTRRRFIYLILIVFGLVFASRLFFIQVVNGEYYKTLAQAGQLRKFEIPANRGLIFMSDGTDKIPLVLNQDYKIIYADPRYVDNVDETAIVLSEILGGKATDYKDLLTLEDRVYVVLKKSVEPAKADELESKQLAGIGMQSSPKRVYPEGALASQLLGFVNNDGEGQYGIEGYLNDELSGEAGLLRAVTDARGIPLSTADNDGGIDVPARDGTDIVLTIERSVQRAVEEAVKKGVERTNGTLGSAIVIDPNSGAILAMANYPTYDPNKFYEVKDPADFSNAVVSDAYEAGSVIKPFTMSAGLQSGAINVDSTFIDSGSVEIDGWVINNAGGRVWGQQDMTSIIVKSINTGAIHVLKQLGGGEINLKARKSLYNFFTNNYRFGAKLGIAQPSENPGILFAPNEAEGNNVKYSNMAFGQGFTTTMLQVSASFTALVNGGDFYQPHLIHSRIDGATGEETINEPKIISNNAISDVVSKEIRKMLVGVVTDGGGYYAKRPGFTIGGKTGTSQLIEADGTYSTSRYTGSFIGFISGKTVNEIPDFVIMTRIVEPQVGSGAGAEAAVPVFADIADFLINYYQITPSS